MTALLIALLIISALILIAISTFAGVGLAWWCILPRVHALEDALTRILAELEQPHPEQNTAPEPFDTSDANLAEFAHEHGCTVLRGSNGQAVALSGQGQC